MIHTNSTTANTDRTTTSNLSVAGGGSLQILPIRLHGNNDNYCDTWCLCDTGSTNSWVDKELVKKLGISGEKTQLKINGINGMSTMDTETIEINVGTKNPNFKRQNVVFYVHPNMQVGAEYHDINELKRKYKHLNVLQKNIDTSKVKLLLGQNAFNLTRPLEYRQPPKGMEQIQPWAVRSPLGWTLSGPLPTAVKKVMPICKYKPGR